MNTHLAANSDFLEFLKEYLKHRAGDVPHFTCLVESSRSLTSRLQSGKRHSTVPALDGLETATTLNGTLSDGGAFCVEYSGTDKTDFAEIFEAAMRCSAPRKHDAQRMRHAGYADLELASAELADLVTAHQAIARVDEMARFLEQKAAAVEHPRLMGREVGVQVELRTRSYLDSAGNAVEDTQTALSAWASFSLTDSSEYHTDAFGTLPEIEELHAVVDEAARNLTNHDVRELEEPAGLAVVLTPKAVVSLFDDLILPNLSARTLLDGTGAWGLDRLGKSVLGRVTMRDDPLVPGSPFSHKFDVEGTPARAVTILDGGILRHPLLTSSLLAEFKDQHDLPVNDLAVTGHASSATEADYSNLFIEMGPASAPTLQELVAGCERCVVVSQLTGMSVDPLTGQFALDAEGARVYARGQLQHSTSLTLRGNFFDAIEDAVVGPTARVYNVRAPALVTRRLSCVPRRMASGDQHAPRAEAPGAATP